MDGSNASAVQDARLFGLMVFSDHWIYSIRHLIGTQHNLQRYILFLEFKVLESAHKEDKRQEYCSYCTQEMLMNPHSGTASELH